MAVEVEIYRDVPATMRDGVVLRADVYLAKGSRTPRPTILTRTAYGKQGFLTDVSDFGALVRRGYAVVVQDKRGRHASDGEYHILRDDSAGVRQDGFDTVEWIARQPWCDGRVDAFGLSYLGHTTMGAAISDPPHLVAGVSIEPATDEYTDRTFIDGVLSLANIVDWASGDLVASSLIDKLPPAEQDAARAELAAYRAAGPDQYRQLPLTDWPFLPHFPLLWTEMLAHREDEGFFAESRVSETEARRITVPIRHVGGWYDPFLRNTVRQFELTRRHSSAADAQQLVVGPWNHGGLARSAIGEVEYPDGGIDTNLMVADWFDGSVQRGERVSPSALIYVLGAEKWRAEPQWPIAGTEMQDWYFGADGSLSIVAPSVSDRSFSYDPRDPYIAPRVDAGPLDHSAQHESPNVVVFTSDPMRESVEITGWPHVVLHASTEAADMDLLAEMHVVDVDGASRIVNEGIARARYRAGRSAPRAVEPGAVEEYEVRLRPSGLQLRPGERLRVLISAGKFPAFERNPQTFADLSTMTEDDFAAATHTLHLGLGLSRIVLPIVPAEAHGEWIENAWPLGPGSPVPIVEAGATLDIVD